MFIIIPPIHLSIRSAFHPLVCRWILKILVVHTRRQHLWAYLLSVHHHRSLPLLNSVPSDYGPRLSISLEAIEHREAENGLQNRLSANLVYLLSV